MAVRKKRPKVTEKASAEKSANRKALWQAYRGLQKRADSAWEKFRSDVRRNAKSDILIKDHNQLLLLLGECNYMARECTRAAAKNKRKG